MIKSLRAVLVKSTHCRTGGSHLTTPSQNKNRPSGRFMFGGSGWIVRDYALTTRTAQTAQSLFSPTIVSNQWFSSHPSITE